MFLFLCLGQDFELTVCSCVNSTKTSTHLSWKTKLTWLHQMGYLFLQNYCEKSCFKNGARLFFNVASKGQWGTCSLNNSQMEYLRWWLNFITASHFCPKRLQGHRVISSFKQSPEGQTAIFTCQGERSRSVLFTGKKIHLINKVQKRAVTPECCMGYLYVCLFALSRDLRAE